MADTLHVDFRPGSFGRTSAAPGILIREITDFALASVIARRGQVAAAAAAAERAYGIALPNQTRLVTGYGMSFLGTGPGQWLALGAAGDPPIEAQIAAALGDTASAFDQSDSRVMLELRGPRVRDVLAKGVSVDLHPTAFAPGHVAATTVSHLAVQLWQTDTAPVYRLLGVRSYFESLWHWLAASSAEFGAQVLPPARYAAPG